jgi:hypothetical protein
MSCARKRPLQLVVPQHKPIDALLVFRNTDPETHPIEGYGLLRTAYRGLTPPESKGDTVQQASQLLPAGAVRALTALHAQPTSTQEKCTLQRHPDRQTALLAQHLSSARLSVLTGRVIKSASLPLPTSAKCWHHNWNYFTGKLVELRRASTQQMRDLGNMRRTMSK